MAMDINSIIQNIIEQYGLISIFIIIMLEYANFPLPSEVILTIVGFITAKSNMNFLSVLLVSVLGGIIGSITNYFIGLYFGKPVIKYLLEKHPKTKKSIKTSMTYLKKYDKLSVMLSRAIPLARTFISIPAGMSKMNITYFILYSSIGITFWNFILIYLGYILGDNIERVMLIMKNYSLLVFAILTLSIIIYYVKRKYDKRN